MPSSRVPRLTRRSVLRIGLGSIGATMLSATVADPGVARWWDDDDAYEVIYIVVVNDEEQYSIWPADRELPLGWYPDGFKGTKHECLAHIEEVWTDMRPKSLRERMAVSGEEGPTP